MLRILFFLCVTLFSVDGRVMGATNVFNGDVDSPRQLGCNKIVEINAELYDPMNSLPCVQECKAKLKRAVHLANSLGQKNSPEINKAATQLNAARKKEAEALRQAEEQQRECLLEEKRNRINGLTKKMSPVYQEINRILLAKVLSTNREDIFITYYDAALNKQKPTQGEVTNIVFSINEALEKLDIRM